MKTIKKIVLFTLALVSISITSIYAQNISIGLRGGITQSNVYYTQLLDQIAPNFSDVTDFSIGAVVEIGISEQFAIQPELGYARKGFGVREGINVDAFGLPIPVGVAAESKFDYIEMPVLAKLKFGGESMKGYIAAGPTVGYALDGRIVTKANALIDIPLGTTPIDLDAINYERFEVGGTVGAGIAWETGVGQLFADVRYNHGFTTLYDIPVVNEKIRNRGFGLNVGFLVPVGN